MHDRKMKKYIYNVTVLLFSLFLILIHPSLPLTITLLIENSRLAILYNGIERFFNRFFIPQNSFLYAAMQFLSRKTDFYTLQMRFSFRKTGF